MVTSVSQGIFHGALKSEYSFFSKAITTKLLGISRKCLWQSCRIYDKKLSRFHLAIFYNKNCTFVLSAGKISILTFFIVLEHKIDLINYHLSAIIIVARKSRKQKSIFSYDTKVFLSFFVIFSELIRDK